MRNIKIFNLLSAIFSLSEETYERYFNISQNLRKGGKIYEMWYLLMIKEIMVILLIHNLE